MPLEYQMLSEPVDNLEAIEAALQANWEPFAVAPILVPRRHSAGKGNTMHHVSHVFFRRQYHNEDREPLSSTRHTNWAGNPPDEADHAAE